MHELHFFLLAYTGWFVFFLKLQIVIMKQINEQRIWEGSHVPCSDIVFFQMIAWGIFLAVDVNVAAFI